MSTHASIVWLRRDLRLSDQPALRAAVERGGAVIPAYLHDPAGEGQWTPGASSDWWLHQSLLDLDRRLRRRGSRLILRAGDSLEELRRLAAEVGATAVFWNRRYEPAVIARDSRIKAALQGDGLEVESFNAALLNEPWTVQNQNGRPFRVFTAFWKHSLARGFSEPVDTPDQLPAPRRWPKSLRLQQLELEPKIDWADGLRGAWTPGEDGAARALKSFVEGALRDYDMGRDRPGIAGTSRLSPHLHFGEIGPRQVVQALKRRRAGAERFLAEIGWREFAYHLLFHFPHTTEHPLREEFKRFRWRDWPEGLEAWKRGQTGYPIVDAGMRELWRTGWMHNRVRMVAASFLVKDLLIRWQEGARWFWDTLVDADLASNTLGWQWVAGCGADAAPFFRVFNPVTQGEKFDPDGAYVRRWVPELSRLPDKWIHQPWNAPEDVLEAAGVVPGRDYPEPVVSHAIAREVALEAFGRIRGGRDQ